MDYADKKQKTGKRDFMDEKMMQKRVRRTISLIVVIGFVLVATVAGLVFYFRSTLDVAVRRQMKFEALEYKLRLEKQMASDFQLLDTVAALIEENGTMDQTEAIQILSKANQRNDFVTMGFFPKNKAGTVAVLDQETHTQVEVSSLEEEVQRVINKAWAGEASMSRLFTGSYTGEKVFAYGIPIYGSDGQVEGALLSSNKIKIFTDILNDNGVMGGNGYIHLLGQEGEFLIRSSRSVVKENLATIFDGPYLSGEVSGQVKKSLENGEEVFAHFRYEGKRYQFFLEPIGINGWYLFCVNTLQTSNQAAYQIVRTMAAVCLGAVFLIVFFMVYGYRLVRKNSRELMYQAYHDSLTGAYNLSFFVRELEGTLRTGRGLYVAALNIHQFKFINEIFGRKQGDLLLFEIRQLLDECLDREEFFCRDTADLFYLCLRGPDRERIRDRLSQMIEQISALSKKRHSNYQVRLYCGVAAADGENLTADQMMTRVMFALDTSRERIQNQIWFYDKQLHEKEIMQNYVESHMEQALLDGEFRLYLQPKMNLKSGKMESAEALVRWITGEGNMIFPDQFIPLFEENGFCIRLDMYMIECACRQIREWMDQGLSPVGISVNQSKLLFYEEDYIEKLEELIARYRIPAEKITLEILEGLALENVEELNIRLRKLQEKGIRISMDDFGSGYSSLNTLADLEIDELKLDRGFLMKVAQEGNLKVKLIMEQIVRVTKRMGIDTVVEGVETEENHRFIQELECDYGQGYYYSKPVSAQEFTEKFLKKK